MTTHLQWPRQYIAMLMLIILIALSTRVRALNGPVQKGAPDFAAARDEAAQILSGFIKVDTTNPPGNETRGSQYLKGILDREGIASEIFELEPGRGNIVARLKGNGKKKPVLLMGHIDTVGIEREKWTFDPFGGSIKDGYVYGRGASDDKGMASACLEVFLLLHRLKVPLDRDVIFLAEAGEEGTSRVGIDFMVEQHWDKIECEYALNEGGEIHETAGKVQYVGVATTEKVSRGMRLVARGTSGHGSMPRPDNAITHLAAATAKVGAWRAPMRLNETTRTFFSRLATVSSAEDRYLFTHLEDPQVSESVQDQVWAKSIKYNSMLRTSIVPTIIKGGLRTNVIPGDAEVTLDVRAVPDEDIPALVESLRRLINDPAVEVIPNSGRSRPSNPPSGLNTEMFLALERSQQHVFPGVITLPLMLTGATDSAQLRAKGVHAYGLGSVVSDRELASVHGNDERLSVNGLGKFVEFIYGAVAELAAPH